MPNINLIHDQVSQRRKLEKKNSLALLGLCGTTVVCFGAFAWSFLQTNSVKDALADAKKKHEAIQPKIDAIAKNMTEYSKLAPKVETLEKAQKATKRWSSILTHIEHNTPSGVWLTAIHCAQSQPTENVTMTLTGKGPMQGPISDFLSRMQNHVALQGVNLSYTQKEQDNIKFEINSQLVGTAYEAPQAQGEKKS